MATTAFHEIQFPTDISYGSEGGPEFSTDILVRGNKSESRNINWTYPRERWNVAYGVKEKSQLAALQTFFYARKGRAIGFRFQNPDDHEAVGEDLGDPLDEAGLTFQLVKTYVSGPGSLVRKITKPVSGTVLVYVNGSLQMSGWTVDTTTGIVTFGSAPGSDTVTASFDFDIPVRFDTDHLPMNFANYEARHADVPLLEIPQ